MLDEIDYILNRVSGMGYESFVRDETLKRAFVRSVEVIGEASKKLPEDIKAMQPVMLIVVQYSHTMIKLENM
ncbi:MAG: DUF86 domain-containing protein [Desulfohalobiaceae bacterium]